MKLKPLSISDMEPIRRWRNSQLSMLRTSFPLTKEMQEEFYHNIVSNRNANAKYWGIWAVSTGKLCNDEFLIGMAGIENIQWENRLGEISLIMWPEIMGRYTNDSLSLILYEGFMNMNLDNIFTEVYTCSPYHKFWVNQSDKYDSELVLLKNRKFYAGNYHDSYYINFNKGEFLYNENIIS